jgi:hypothetical protein
MTINYVSRYIMIVIWLVNLLSLKKPSTQERVDLPRKMEYIWLGKISLSSFTPKPSTLVSAYSPPSESLPRHADLSLPVPPNAPSPPGCCVAGDISSHRRWCRGEFSSSYTLRQEWRWFSSFPPRRDSRGVPGGRLRIRFILLFAIFIFNLQEPYSSSITCRRCSYAQILAVFGVFWVPSVLYSFAALSLISVSWRLDLQNSAPAWRLPRWCLSSTARCATFPGSVLVFVQCCEVCCSTCL